MSVRIGPGDIEGIVLDAVGTLIQPAPSVAQAYAAAASRQGVEVPASVLRERFREQFGLDEIDEQRGPLATDEATERRRWRRIVGGCLPEIPDPDRAFAELWDHFADPASWVVFDDVTLALDRLRRVGVRVAIGSNFDSRLRRVLEGLPALARWDGPIVVSSEVGYRKPHAAFYEAACRELGVSPEKALCVGDDPENDLHGPGRAGLRAVLVDRERRLPEGLPAVGSLAEVAEFCATPGGRD